LYWTDSGIPRAMKRQLWPVAAEERGHLFEGWIASILRAYMGDRSLATGDGIEILPVPAFLGEGGNGRIFP